MTGPELGQLVNAVVSTAVCLFWLSQWPRDFRLGTRWVQFFGGVCIAITAWYATINFSLVFKLALVDSPTQVIPWFRYAFPVLLVAPALRTYAYRPLANRIEQVAKGDSPWKDSVR